MDLIEAQGKSCWSREVRMEFISRKSGDFPYLFPQDSFQKSYGSGGLDLWLILSRELKKKKNTNH